MSVVREIREEVGRLDQSPRALRRFGWVVGGVFAGIAALIAWRGGGVGGWALGLGLVGGGLLLAGTLAPPLLRPVYRLWMGLAFVLGYVMTRVILTAVFVVLVVPIGLALRLAGKDILRLRRDPSARSYWELREPDAPLAERLGRLY